MVALHEGFEVVVAELQKVPPAPHALPVKSFAWQTKSRTSSVVSTVSVSLDVENHVTNVPGSAGELSEKAVNTGGWFTKKGDAVEPEPCRNEALHRGSEAFASQIHAYQSFCSTNASVVVVAAVACEPLVVVAETAQRLASPPPQVGGAPEFAVGAVLVLHTRRK